MISSALTLIYITACFLGLQGVTFIVIALKHNDSGNTKLLKATRNFVMASLFVGAYYFFTYYREIVLGEFQASILMRALDAMQFYILGMTWVQLVDAISGSENHKLKKWRKAIIPVFVVLMIISASTYVFLLDDMYRANFAGGNIIVISGEIILGLSVIVFTIAFVSQGYKELVDNSSRSYIMIVSLLVNFNNLWNNIVVVAVFLHAVKLNVICSQLYGVTAVAIMIINIYSLIYIYKKDFSPLYSLPLNMPKKQKLSEEGALDFVAEKHRLTEREREVMILAYHGLTNPDIADELYISKHTVKRHMHNLFEKLDVSTRVELIHLISTQMT